MSTATLQSPLTCIEETGPLEAAGAVEDVVFDRPPLDDAPSFLFILPVLFVEFVAIAVTRSLLPGRLNAYFGDRVYLVIGVAETVKGLLAFWACPLFGKLSDMVGRRPCLVVTVFGTIFPCFCPAFTDDLWVYVTALGLSGLFAATFTLVFAYIADVVSPAQRAPAYGLALATLGLSFTVGPPLGAYAARQVGERLVFLVSLALAVFDVLFICFALPESRPLAREAYYARRALAERESLPPSRPWHSFQGSFDPLDTLELFRGDPLLSRVAVVVFFYYSGVWALVTTLVIYVVRVFGLSTTQVGWLLGTYGLSTMVAEAGLVRLVVPVFGELATIRLGLLSFALQCIAIALARTPDLIWASIALSLLSNLVYPAVSSLVSRNVPPATQGEALGAINGVKALTEGAGPLAFASLMSSFENTRFPGLPYLACAALAALALAVTCSFPSEESYALLCAKGDARCNGGHELVPLVDDNDVAPQELPKRRLSEPRFKLAEMNYTPGLTTTSTTFPVGLASAPASLSVPQRKPPHPPVRSSPANRRDR